MDRLTITEALYSIAFMQDGANETNIITMVRNAQAIIAKENPGVDLHAVLDPEYLDAILIIATQNGGRDIMQNIPPAQW